jgi:hypothetical protein
MFLRTIRSVTPALMILLIAILACSIPQGVAPVQAPAQQALPANPAVGQVAIVESPSPVPPTSTVTVTHLMTPASPASGKLVYDVESQSTAPERRAPYGDSYDINRLERPFQQDMTYVPDLDINTYTVAGDTNWWYVSVELIGTDPNNALNINYGVELDLDHDGFGDYLIWTHPPYTTSWDTAPVQIFQDKNHNTGGLSGEKSDAPITTDGYETLIFNGGPGDADPDMAWVRINAGAQATVQFAFKKSWSGVVFMLGTLADAGLKDPKKLDYVDRFTIVEAGSPVRDNKNYPLKALYEVDNACREAFGFKATGYEPQLCPHEPPPSTKRPHATNPPGCVKDPTCTGCTKQWDPVNCTCIDLGPC